MNNFLCIILLFIPCFCYGQKSILNDPATSSLVEQCIQSIYNTELEKSDQIAEKIRERLPGHPAYPMLKALALRWKYAPVDVNGDIYPEIKKYLRQTQEAAATILDENPDSPEAKFISLIAHALQAMFYEEEGSYLKAVGEAKDAYGYVKEGFVLKEKYPEFYFSTGLYNYYREAYPEKYPVYRPFLLFFKKGDKTLGLEQLDWAVKNSVFMKAEAGLYLSHLYSRYELKPDMAIIYGKDLIRDYPNNPIFRSDYIEALLEVGNYEEADSMINFLIDSKSPYFEMCGQVFKGIIEEKLYNNRKAAKKRYEEALKTGKDAHTDRALDIKSIAYTGLGRLAKESGNMNRAKLLYKEAHELAQYDNTRAEADEFLKGK